MSPAMQELKNIKTFLFNKAEYRIADGYGHEALLCVDYAGNEYQVIGDDLDQVALDEISKFACDLLKRKHGRNFAERE